MTQNSRFPNPTNHSSPIHLSINHHHLQVVSSLSTSSGYVRGTSGKQPSLHLPAIMNIGSCRMDLLTPPPYSRILCTRYSGSFSISSCSFTSMTYLYTPGVRPNIASTLRRSSNGYGRITCSLKQRNAPSINLQSNSWVTTSTSRASKWTRGR